MCGNWDREWQAQMCYRGLAGVARTSRGRYKLGRARAKMVKDKLLGRFGYS